MTQPVSWSLDSLDPQPLSPFQLGVGVQLDAEVDSTDPDPAVVAQLHDVGVKRYRVNLRWDVISRGSSYLVDHDEVDRVALTIERLLAAGIEPLVAIDNVSLPSSLEADGGWRNEATVWAYGDFVGALGARLGYLVDEWITIGGARPRNFDPSMTNHLVAAQQDAARILRGHVPHAMLGASVDIAQLDDSRSPAHAASAQAWISHLASPEAAIDFVALDVDPTSIRRPERAADALRSLDARIPGRSFVLTESLRPRGDRRQSNRLDDIGITERFGIVEALFEQIRRLRADRIDINAAFAWPFSGTAPLHGELNPDSIEAYRRVLTAGVI